MKTTRLTPLAVYASICSSLLLGTYGFADTTHTSPKSRVPFESVQRGVDIASTVLPLVPQVASGTVRLQNMIDLASGKTTPAWRDAASLVGRVVGGNWMVNYCADAYVPKSVDKNGRLTLYAYNPNTKSLNYSFGGAKEAASDKYGWSKAQPAVDKNGHALGKIQIELERDHFTLVTLRAKNRQGEQCTITLKVHRTGDALEISRVVDPNTSLDVASQPSAKDMSTTSQSTQAGTDPYGFGALLNQYRAQHGLGPLTYDPYLDNVASSNNSSQVASNTVGHFDLSMPYGTAIRQNSSRRVSAYAAMYGDGVYDQVGWVHSPGHNEALLDPTVTRYGIAAASAAGMNAGRPASDAYWTLELSTKPGDVRNPDGSLSLAP